MKIHVHGAAKTVTGSKYVVETGGVKILVDAGLFQGPDELEQKNFSELPFDAASLDAIVLTHGHLDHVGLLPRIVREGFRGKIISTSATRDIAQLILLDSARLQEEEADRRARKNRERGRNDAVREPLYDEQDVVLTMSKFAACPKYGETFDLGKNVTGCFRDAGHIVGSSFLELEARENGSVKRVIFSGDIGNHGKPVVRDPAPPVLKDADAVFIECTYGDRNHKSSDETLKEFREAVVGTLKGNGNVIIPTFALERAQDLLFYLRQFYDEGALPKCKIFLDSPLAIAATRVFLQHPECFDDETMQLVKSKEDPFHFPYVEFTRTTAASCEINSFKSGAVILAGSGMCNGGRIRHHLIHNLSNPRAAVVFVGYQAGGTLGRSIVDGAKDVRINSHEIEVRACVHTINGFSAHADQDSLLQWLSTLKTNPKVFLIHGEESAIEIFKGKLAERYHFPSYVPSLDETLSI